MLDRHFAIMRQMFANLSSILDKAVAHADANADVSIEDLLDGKLAPDMFDLKRQIQSATDSAKFAAARLAGVDAPSWPDDETTVDELKARLAKAAGYLEEAANFDFSGWETRAVTIGWMPGMEIDGADYFHQFALPNFFFHVTTAYAILRSAGVDIGKRDFIGHMSFRPVA